MALKEMKLDETISAKEIGLDPIDVFNTIGRIALMGSRLEVHECFTSKLGVGDVEITRFPNSIRIVIYWNEKDMPPTGIYTLDSSDAINRQIQIDCALKKYLAPSLEGE
jgi:hypothetical protein